MIRYRLPSVGSVVQLDRRCPHCSCPNGRIHSGIRLRHISDPKAETICQRRMKCPRCGMTWTVRCEGVGPGRQRSDKLIGLGVLGHMLGLSYRNSCQLLACLDCSSSKSSIERDVAAAGRTDPTNNVTERIIGLTYKIRAKTMRGFKVEAKALQHAYLSSFLRGEDGMCDLRKVI